MILPVVRHTSGTEGDSRSSGGTYVRRLRKVPLHGGSTVNAVSDICRQCLLANLSGKPIQRGRNFCAARVMGRVTSKVAQWSAKMLGGEHPDIAIGAQDTADRNRKSVAGEPRQIPSLPTDLLGANARVQNEFSCIVGGDVSTLDIPVRCGIRDQFGDFLLAFGH